MAFKDNEKEKEYQKEYYQKKKGVSVRCILQS